jgi:tripartite-type tricarboxylate transporter receptor subunit TctC
MRSGRDKSSLSQLRFAAIAAVAVGVAGYAAQAQDWPSRPVKILVPFAAGGNTDIIARIAAERLGHVFKGASFVVENQPGAGGLTAAAQVARAAPDGATLFMAASPQLVIAPAIQQVSFDPLKDFTPIKIVASNPFVLIVHKSVPAKDLAGLLAHAKASDGKFSYATGGSGSVSHLSVALLFSKSGVDAKPVFYRGNAPALTDVLAGHLPMIFANLSEALAQAKNEDIKFFAVSSAKRIAQLPDVPTAIESGFPGFELGTWNGLVGPAGLPQEIVAKIEGALAEYVANSEVQAKFRGMGLEADLSTSAGFGERIRRELPLWADIIKVAGVKPPQQ